LLFPKDLNTHPLEPLGIGNRLFYRCTRIFSLCLMKTYFRLRSEGPPPPPRGPFIVAANHESFLDPIVLQLALGARRVHYMMLASFYYTRLLNRYCNVMRCIPIREDGPNRESLRLALDVLAAGRPVGIFPQGGRMAPGDMTGGMMGVGFLARKAGVPVIPARIDGCSRALPVGALFPRPARISVRLGAWLDFSGAGGGRGSLDEITQRIMSAIDVLRPESSRQYFS
jgi:1-acyl-sn-glycerol-3-phosphate acyltransferase